MGATHNSSCMWKVLCALLVCFASSPLHGELLGKVVGVHDGDSITVLTEDKTEMKVRLEGIDAPELKQAFGNVAKQELSRLVFGKEVRLTDKGKDRYKRTLADVHRGETWANEVQVKAGMAWVFLRYCHDPRLLAAERTARESKRGLWKDKEPVPP